MNRAEKFAYCLKQARETEYSAWVKQVQLNFPDLTILNPILCGDADLAVHVFQLIWACWLIARKQYVPPSDQEEVFTLLYFPLDRVHGESKVFELISRYRSSNPELGHVVTNSSIFSQDVMNFMVGTDQPSYLARSCLKASLVYFTDEVFMATAQAFEDEESVLFYKKRLLGDV